MNVGNVGSIEYDARIATTKLKADAAEVDRIAKKSGDDLANRSDHGTNRAGDAFKKFAKVAAAALAVTGVAVTAFGVSAVKAFQESENAITQTEAVLKSTNGVAGVTAKTVTDLANSLQRQTRYSDETIRSAENMLLTFTNISDKTFPGATEAVLDMATAMGSDLQSTAIQVGKALQDPVLGATALQRVGVRLTESQKDLIKSLVASGDAAGAQAIILKELQTEFGGSAKAAGKTFAGQLDILKNQFGEVQESIGFLIVRALVPLTSGMLKLFDRAGGVDGIMKTLTDTFMKAQPTLKQWWENISNTASIIANYLQPKITALYNTFTEKLLPALGQMVKAFGPTVGAGLVWVLGTSIDFLNAFLTAISPVITFLSDHTWIVWGLVAAFVAFKGALLIDSAVKSFQASMALIRAQALLTTGTMATTTTGAGLLRTALLRLAGPWQIALAIIGAETVIWSVNEIRKAIDKLNQGLEDLKHKQVDVGGKKVGGTTDIGLTTQLMNSFKGFRAGGGPVQAGKSYIVGENQPELFVPRTSGNIIPEVPEMNSRSGNNITINLSMQGIMTRSKADERDIGKSLIRVVNEELKSKGLPLIAGGSI